MKCYLRSQCKGIESESVENPKANETTTLIHKSHGHGTIFGFGRRTSMLFFVFQETTELPKEIK